MSGIFKSILDALVMNCLQFRALIRQYKKNLVQILLPVMCVLYIYFLQALYDYSMNRLDLEAQIEQHKEYVYSPVDLRVVQLLQANYANYTDFPNILYFTTSSEDVSRLLLNFKPHEILLPFNEGNRNSSRFIEMSSSRDIDFELFTLLNIHESNMSINALGSFSIEEYSKGKYLEYTLQYDHHLESQGSGNFFKGSYLSRGLTGVSYFCQNMQLMMNTRSCDELYVVSLMDLVQNELLIKQSKFFSKYLPKGITTWVQQMEYKAKKFKLSLNLKEYLDVYFFSLILNLLLPIFMYKLVLEKKNKIKEMMKIQGMRYHNYMLSNALLMFLMYILSCLVLSLLGWIFRYRFITQTHPIILLVLFIGSGFLVISHAFLLSSVLRDELVATMIGYFLVLFVPVSGFILDFFVMEDGNWKYKPILAILTLSISDSVWRIAERCEKFTCLDQVSDIWTNKDLLIALLCLYFFSVIWMMLGIYLDLIFPQEWGKRSNICFCCTPICQIFFRRKKKKNRKKQKVMSSSSSPSSFIDDEGVRREKERILSGLVSERNRCVIVKGITKNFKKKIAVDNVYFSIRKNEVFCLLGPNGAGKTSLLRCLVGLYDPNDGDASIIGKSILSEMNDIRKRSLSFCPQFDVQWNELTPREHLLFYSRLKCVSPFSEQSHVDEILTRVGLNNINNSTTTTKRKCCIFCCGFFCRFFRRSCCEKRVFQLSEGMKRRLSIGISLCGSPDVVILDEPSEGLDITAKRDIWKIILSAKEKTTIIITTHSMEESEALSDTIGIMDSGKLICLGNSLELKNRYGTGYTLTITTNNREKTINYISENIDGIHCSAKMINEFGEDQFSFELSPLLFDDDDEAPVMNISDVFQLVQPNEENGIVDWNLNQSTIENVFLNVIKKAEDEEIKDEKMKSKVESFNDINEEFNNITINEFNNEREEVDDENMNEIIIEIEETKKEQKQKHTIIKEEEGEEKKVKKICFFCCFECLFQTWYLFKKNLRLSCRDWFTTLSLCFSPVLPVIFLFVIKYAVVRKNAVIYPEIESNLSIIPRCTPWGNNQCYNLVFSTNSGRRWMADEVMNDLINIQYPEYFKKEGVDYFNFSGDCDSLSKWILRNPNITQTAICFGDGPICESSFSYIIYFNDTTMDFDVGDVSKGLVRWYKRKIDNTLLKLLQKKYGSQKEEEEEINNNQKENMISVRFKPFPKLQSRKLGETIIFAATGAFMLSLSSMLMFIVILQKLVFEKENKMKISLQIVGMKTIPFYCSWFLLFLLIDIIMSIVIVLAGVCFLLSPFLYCDQLILFSVFFLFNLSLISIAFFFSVFINSKRTAIVFGFIFFSITCILDDFLANGNVLYFFMDHGAPGFIPIIFEIIYPIWNFSKIIVDIIHKTSVEWNPLEKKWVHPKGFGFKNLFGENSHNYEGYGVVFTTQATYISFLYLLFNIFLYFLLFLISEIICSNCSINKLILYSKKVFKNKKESKKKREDIFDEDIKKEINLVKDDEDFQLKTIELEKTFYQIGKITRAVKPLSLGIEKNCLFTLIGKNSAGKTTTLLLIAGVHLASGGDIHLDNKSIHSNPSFFQRNLGLCHQSSTLYPNLTAAEHIQLFCEIKGMTSKETKKEVERLLKKVSLWNVRNNYTKTFSGGMNRRLAVAIACIGKTKLILLDESSNGLDPYSRRKIWEFILELKKNHTVIMTTHNLEEVELLSDRIGILVDGELKGIGNKISLKKKYGNCFFLNLSTISNNTIDDDDNNNNNKKRKEEQLFEILKKHFEVEQFLEEEGIEIINSSGGRIKNNNNNNSSGGKMYKVKIYPQMIEKLTSFLEKLVKNDDELNHIISAFGVNSTSLEDVFLKVVEDKNNNDEEEETRTLIDENSPLLLSLNKKE